MAKLPNKIYIIDPYDEDGNLVPNTEDVCWCADPVGDENIAYIAEQTITDALAALRAADSLIRLYNEWEDDLDETCCSTGWKTCIICDGGGHEDGRRRRPIKHKPDCPRELWNNRPTIAALGLAPKEDNGTN